MSQSTKDQRHHQTNGIIASTAFKDKTNVKWIQTVSGFLFDGFIVVLFSAQLFKNQILTAWLMAHKFILKKFLVINIKIFLGHTICHSWPRCISMVLMAEIAWFEVHNQSPIVSTSSYQSVAWSNIVTELFLEESHGDSSICLWSKIHISYTLPSITAL